MNEQEAASATADTGVEKRHKSRARGHVTIFGTWCKGCGLCIEFCPQGVFEANGGGRPVVAHDARCTACHFCDTHCPDMAIRVRRLDEEQVEELEELTHRAEEGTLPAGGDL